MKVLKFGGTSVGNAENIEKVIQILLKYKSNGDDLAVVFSAMSQMTNRLIAMSTKAAEGNESYTKELKEFENMHIEAVRKLIDAKGQSTVFANIKRKINELEDLLQGVFLVRELSPKTLDHIQSHGERLNAYVISEAANQRGLEAQYLDARKVIKTDSNFGSARIDFKKTNKNITNHFAQAKGVQCITGFVSSNDDGETTTLGRGGSDYTASVFAAALDADVVEIWTDVDGVMTADPRKVKNAFTLPAISYNEAMELSHFGAKVIYPPTLQPVFTKKIPIKIKNTFNPDCEGTHISDVSGEPHKHRVKGISSINDIALLNIMGSGMVGVTGVSARLFGALANAHVNIILITQASSEHSICLAIDPKDTKTAKNAIEDEFHYEIDAKKINPVHVEEGLSVIALIGENMKSTPGISAKLFNALGKNGINVAAIAQGSSELNISAVIPGKDTSKALNALHDELFLSGAKTLNIYMVGPGLIGATLLKQIDEQGDYLRTNRGLNINVVGLANSRKMVFNEDGINLQSWEKELDGGETADLDGFVARIKDLNLPNSIFVDNTANKDIVRVYEGLLDSSVNIVTPNKVANSGPYSHYKALKDAAFRRGVEFLYETNVGAGLPVINTLQDLINSGDSIISIEGVLSGSLSFIFNTYDGSTTFKEIVQQAKENGYTEPDPRDDLNGMDVARKILILSRESGLEMEPEDVKIENILPDSCINAKSVDDFFVELEKADATFKELSDDAIKNNQKLRFIATLIDGKVTVGLKAVGMDHPFYSMAGSDNMISYTTQRYKSNPLVIKGPGAGAEVTAAGVFADIIRISNN